jgi:hypothetical protein
MNYWKAFVPCPRRRGRSCPEFTPWDPYFRVGNSGQAFGKIKYEVERKVRRLAAKKCKREGFGWRRWSSAVVYGTWGLFRDYRVVYWSGKACPG